MNGLSRQRFWAAAQKREPLVLAVDRGGSHAVTAMVERLRLCVGNQAAGIAVGLVRSVHADPEQDPSDQGGDRLVLIVDHAVTDGLGALELLRELLDVASNGPGALKPMPVPATTGEDSRCSGGSGAAATRRRPMFRQPARIAPQSTAPSCAGFGYRMTALNLGKAPGTATTNDVLMAATVLAVEQWNARHGRQGGSITVQMPISARKRSGRHSAIGNATGHATFSARVGTREPWRLLQEVTAASAAAKAAGATGFSPAEAGVIALRWLPAGVRSAVLRRVGRVAAPWIMPTVTVSNLGPVDGRLVGSDGLPFGVRSLYFLTTAGMPQGVAVTAAKLNGTLHVGLSFANELMDNAGAESFLSMIVNNAELMIEPVPNCWLL